MQETTQPKKNRMEEAIQRRKMKRILWIAGSVLVAVLLIMGVILGLWPA